jgi:hypothetical protein
VATIGTQQIPSDIYILPHTLGASIVATAQALAHAGDQALPETLLYAEKAGGFQCGTCCWATPVNGTHGKCAIMVGTVHLKNGCCAAWQPDTEQLHLYREMRSQ